MQDPVIDAWVSVDYAPQVFPNLEGRATRHISEDNAAVIKMTNTRRRPALRHVVRTRVIYVGLFALVEGVFHFGSGMLPLLIKLRAFWIRANLQQHRLLIFANSLKLDFHAVHPRHM